MTDNSTKQNIPPADKSRPYQNYCVAFLDILGQKEKLRQICLPITDEEYTKFISMVRDTHGAVLSFRKEFRSLFDRMYSSRITPTGLTDDQLQKYQEIKDRSKKLKPSLFFFSDTIVISLPISDEHGVIQLEGIFKTLSAIGSCLLLMISGGKVFRGGIEVGIGCMLEENEIYGPAAVRAWELENTVAKYPRIIIGDDLIRLLQISKMETQDDVQKQINKDIAEKCLKSFMRDGDGQYALDYLGKEYSTSIGPYFPNLFNDATLFLENWYEEIRETKNTEQYLRYRCLEDYFNSRIDLWKSKDETDHS